MARRFPFRRQPQDRQLIHVVANPNSGRGQGHDETKRVIIELLRQAFPDSEVANADIRVFLTKSLSDLDEAREAIRTERPGFLVIIGGDGTIQMTLGKDEALLHYLTVGERPPQVVVVDLGTFNTIGKTLGIRPRRPVQAVKTFIEKIRRGHPLDTVHRHILSVNGKFAMIVGFGLAARFIAMYNEKPKRGIRRAIVTMLLSLWSQFARHLPFSKRRSIAEPFEVAWTFESDGAVVGQGEGWATGLIASSLEQVGMGIQATHRALERVEHFHVVLSNLGFWQTALNLPNMFRGRPLIGDAQDEVVTAATFRFKEPMPFMLDGEMQEAAEAIDIRRGPLITFVRLTP